MNDLKLTVKFDLKNNAELQEILDNLSKNHNLKINTNLPQINNQFKNFFTEMQAGFARFGLALQGIQQAVGLIKLAADSIIKPAADFETLRVRLVNLYQDAEKAGQVFEQFKDIAVTTPFDLRGVVEAGASLKAFGLNAEDTLKSVADLAAYMGVDIVEASQAVGRAFAGGVGAAHILRDRGILELIRSFKGIDDLTKISLPEFRQAMLDTFSDPASGIAGATDLLSQTYTGAVANMQDAWTNFMSAMGSTVTPVIGAGVRALTSFLESIIPVKTELERVTDQTISQQAEFSSLVETYKILRFEQKQNVESNSALKGIIDKLNKDYSQYIGNIDLATASYKNFQKAVEKASDELIKEAQIKLINAERSDKIQAVVNNELKRKKEIFSIQQQITKEEIELRKYGLRERIKAMELEFEEIQAAGGGAELTRQLEFAKQELDARESYIERKRERIKKINNENNAEKAKLEKDLSDFASMYADYFVNAIEPPKKGGGGGGSSDPISDTIKNQIESLRRSLLEKEALLKEDYDKNRQFIQLNIKDELQRNEMLTALFQKYVEDKNELKNIRYQSEKQLTDDMDKLHKEYLQNKYKTISENYKILQEYHDYQYDMTVSAEQRRFDEINNFYDKYKSLLISLGLTEEEIEAQREERLRQASEGYYAFQKAVESVQSAIEGAFGNVLSEVIVEHKSFAKQMTQVWKNLRIAIVREIEMILVKTALLKLLNFASGGTLSWGQSLIGAINGNTNAYNFNLPSFSLPDIPQVTSINNNNNLIDLSPLETRLDKLAYRLEKIEQKDYNVVVSTKFRGVEFAKEINKAQQAYQEVIK